MKQGRLEKWVKEDWLSYLRQMKKGRSKGALSLLDETMNAIQRMFSDYGMYYHNCQIPGEE